MSDVPSSQDVTALAASSAPRRHPSGFGRRLREERERRQVTLAAIANDTKINLSLLHGLEGDDVSRWPSGIFRRSFIRAYAQAVGLEPDAIVREFLELHPDPIDVFASAGSVQDCPGERAASAPASTRLGSLFHSAVASLRGISPPAGVEPALRSPAVVIRIHIVRGASALPRRERPDSRCRWAGVACDAAILSLTAAGASFMAGGFWAPFAIAMFLYYVTSILMLGNTPGMWLFTLGGEPARRDSSVEPGASKPPGRSGMSWVRHVFGLGTK